MTHQPHCNASTGVPVAEPPTATQWLAGFLNGMKIVLPSEKPHRRFAVILYADVVDYARLTEADEEGTHKRLVRHMDALAGKIRFYGGIVAHYAGDAVLAEFGDVASAVKCAVSVQQEIAGCNAGFPVECRVEFRIGLNMGEVIGHRGDIYGNPVNIAARLQTLAEPGGVVVSDYVRANLGQRLPVACISLGEQWMKNISVPVRAHRLELQTSRGVSGGPDTIVPLKLLRQ